MRTLVVVSVACAGLGWAGTLAGAPDEGLVGRWVFGESDGRTVSDRSGRGNPGLVEDAQLRSEKGGRSLELDGFGAQVRIDERAPFALSNALTAALWVRVDDLRDRTVLFGKPHTNDEWTTPMFGMYLDGGRVVFGLWGSRGAGKMLLESDRGLPARTWVHLAGTFDGAAARLYFNGQAVGERTHGGVIVDNGEPLRVGCGRGGAKPSLRGRIGELRLYNRALPPAEVAALFRDSQDLYDTVPPPPPPPPRDGMVMVESHGRSPDDPRPWRANPTRTLELLNGFSSPGTPPPRNAYGSCMESPASEATGFFRVARIGGRTWLIDPDGCRHYNIGMNAVWEPRGVDAAFGSTARWAEAVTELLRTNGFTGLGNWSSPSLRAVARPLPYVRRHDFMFSFARAKGLVEPAAGTQGFPHRCMPVFHRDFEAHCEEFARALADTAGDPWMVGIMTDNELQCPVDLLDRYLALDADHADYRDGRAAAAAWLAARRGPAARPADIRLRDRYEFIAFAFERYYRIVTAAIRRRDPNHLYLGSRLNYSIGQFDNPWFWKAIAPYHDVVSVNYYTHWGPDPGMFANWEAWAGRPILLTEWYSKAMDVPSLANTRGAGWLVRTQADRGLHYQHFALGALEIPTVVGWHFFKYLDDPSDSTALDNMGGANKGLCNVRGQPHTPLLDRARAVNVLAYPLIRFLDGRR